MEEKGGACRDFVGKREGMLLRRYKHRCEGNILIDVGVGWEVVDLWTGFVWLCTGTSGLLL
jgi:hypothetical protein